MRCVVLTILLPGLASGCYLLEAMVPIALAGSASELPENTPIGTPGAVHGGLGLGITRSDASWQPADDLAYVALDADRRLSDSPIWVSAFFGVGYSDEVPASSPRGAGATSTVDFGCGARHYRALGPFEPFVGAGFAFLDRRFTYTDEEPGNLYDYSFGFYLEAGLDVAIVENFALGVLARQYTGTDQSLAAHMFEADCTTFYVMLSFRR